MNKQNNPLKNPALLIVDMQNDFVRQNGPLQVPDALVTVPAHQALIAAFRTHGHPVIYTKFLSTQAPSMGWIWSPECEPHTKCCWQGHKRHYSDLDTTLECTEIIDELRPEADDLIIEKYGYGAFHGTPLNDSLRDMGVGSLVLTGTVTQICVEETGRQAFHHRFPTTMVSDAVSSFDPELHTATLRNFAMKFGWVQSSADIIAALT
ncbi:MAG: cysteine hydrolase [Rhodospirillaceae bacterium]|jgi:nicotinamidase-related amidase|nr:cysteine hydrolase [Rhodospirillaceae bacterium]MBT4043741.1 cysteine hydrolase [Rhodospirillaceae bacterium]MBT4688482.1 cysteine hydrolase [Rhodospirillaceae bacterium]MBT5079843.1 cysteine hydrolase [Rhodospirillaceae bacterium]MBT5523299.1 cysteine hydrolase [Rhodospirillaceae bacterium]